MKIASTIFIHSLQCSEKKKTLVYCAHLYFFLMHRKSIVNKNRLCELSME